MILKCSKHGFVYVAGKAQYSCPICYERCIPVFLIPKIYIDKSAIKYLFWSFIIAISATAFIYLIMLISSSVHRANIEKAQRIEKMSPIWRALMYNVESTGPDKEIKVTSDFVDSRKEILWKVPLTEFDNEMILGKCSYGNRAEVAAYLNPFLVNSKDASDFQKEKETK